MTSLRFAAALSVAAFACTHVQLTQGAVLSLNERVTTAINNSVPGGRLRPNPALCGVVGQGFLGEFSNRANLHALEHPSVPFEWVDIVQPWTDATDFRPPTNYAQKDIYLSGLVVHNSFSRNDVLFAHPFGPDESIDIVLDAPFRDALVTPDVIHSDTEPATDPATAATEVSRFCSPSAIGGVDCVSTMHLELEQGLWPHLANGAPWYVPQVFDRVVTSGKYILDCGHPANYSSEIHPPTFLAFAHRVDAAGNLVPSGGVKTISHAFGVPYRTTQLYNQNAGLANAFEQPDRLRAPGTHPFPQHLAEELKRVVLVQTTRLYAHALIEPVDYDNRGWYVCAPSPKPINGTLKVNSHFTVRTGVGLQVIANEDLGCAQVITVIGPDYSPVKPVRHESIWPWDRPARWPWENADSINKGASDAAGRPIDVRQQIKDALPGDVGVYWIIDNDPHIDYYDPLIIGAIAPAQLVTDDAQPFPFYGTVEVAWKAGSTTATGPAGGVPDATSGVGSTMRVLLISAEPSPLEFTPISSGPQTVTVTNISKIQLTLGNPALTGPEMADFAIDSGCRGASLAPGATCQIGVTFRPQGVGVRSAELDMVFAGGARAAAVQITGPGLIP